METQQVCRRIKAARITAGFDTQDQAATALKLPLATYRRFESGTIPRLAILVDLCKLFRTNPNAILGWEP